MSLQVRCRSLFVASPAWPKAPASGSGWRPPRTAVGRSSAVGLRSAATNHEFRAKTPNLRPSRGIYPPTRRHGAPHEERRHASTNVSHRVPSPLHPPSIDRDPGPGSALRCAGWRAESSLRPFPASPAPLTPLWTASGPAAPQPKTWGPAIDPATGDIWVAVPYDSTYWIFGPDGTYKESWGTHGTGPGQFAFLTIDPNPSPFGSIAFAPDGSFFVADVGNFRVQAFDKDRNFVRQWGTFGTDDGQFTRNWSIATDGTTVYVGDDGRLDSQAFDTDGTYLRTIRGMERLPGFFALDPLGRIVTTTPRRASGLRTSA